MITITTKDELQDFLVNDFGVLELEKCYAQQEEYAFENDLPILLGDLHKSVLIEVWNGDISQNLDDVEFKISDEDAISVMNDLLS